MKYMKLFIVCLLCICTLSGCSKSNTSNVTYENAINIVLSDNDIKIDDAVIDEDSSKAVYKANDIIYYEDGKDFTYGEGNSKDAHSKEDANKHTVVHISKAGTYKLSGKLSAGQIAIDLGKDAETDPQAVVTLVLDNIDITCEVAPAIIFYNVYECGIADEDKASKDVDTSKAGANVIICDGTTNNVNGSYVAKIYKPASVVLNSDKTKVEDAKKLHKYDAAFYSKMSMNVSGESKNTGVLNINAKNEGLDSELHLTINGGNININSGNDGINTNEDNVSVTTINNGTLNIVVNGETGEGDGIDSNGWLVINGGTVIAQACATSADAGIDSDKGIHINGGTVFASGSMLDSIENGGQTYAVFNFSNKLASNTKLLFKNEKNKAVMDYTIANSCSMVIFSSSDLKEGEYTLWNGDKQLGYGGTGVSMGPGGMRPNGNMNMPDGFDPNSFDKNQFGNGQKPDNLPDNFNPSQFGNIDPNQFGNMKPDGQNRPGNMPDNFDPSQFGNIDPNQFGTGQRPDGQNRPNQGQWGNQQNTTVELTKTFKIEKGANMFSRISE